MSVDIHILCHVPILLIVMDFNSWEVEINEDSHQLMMNLTVTEKLNVRPGAAPQARTSRRVPRRTPISSNRLGTINGSRVSPILQLYSAPGDSH